MLDFVFENQTNHQDFSEEFFKNIFESALKHLKLDNKNVELGLQIITQQRSQELNNQYRHKDKPTDVLSFPLNEHDLEEKHGILPLGDIFICFDVAKHQADEIKIPLSQEMARLAVHGLLHLLDYDHERSSEAEKEMIDLQENILKDLES